MSALGTRQTCLQASLIADGFEKEAANQLEIADAYTRCVGYRRILGICSPTDTSTSSGWMDDFVDRRSMLFALLDPDFESPPTSDFVHLLKRP